MSLIKRLGGSIGALVFTVLLIGIVSPAAAYQQADQNQKYEILMPYYYTDGFQSPVVDMAKDQVAATLHSRYGTAWKVHSWSPQTGTPRWVYGMSVKVANAIRSDAEVDALARQVIASNQDVLRADGTELRLTATPHVDGKWAAHYQQTWHGYDVLGATVRILFSEDGKLMLMGSDYHSAINLSPIATVSRAQAIDIAKSGVPFNPGADTVEDATPIYVLPYPLAANQVEYHLVYQVRVHTADPIGIWVTNVDAQSGKVLSRMNDVSFLYRGTTIAPEYQYGYCDQTLQLALPYLNITVSGVGNTTSDPVGNWSIAGTGGSRAVTANLSGPYVDVNNRAGARAVFNGTAQENVPLTVRFDDLNAQMDERVVFGSISDIHNFYATFAPSFHYTNTRISAYVRVSGTCNAYWDGTINFYPQGGGCANTGEMKQVVYHEFCHGITNEILGGQGVNGMGEGNSDILGNLITQDHIIGRGFYVGQCTSGIRDSQNSLRFPQDLHGEVHWDGQIIAGFNWDAMVGLETQYGDSIGTWMSAARWHNGRVLLHPQDQPDQVLATFTADDDNGNLGDGTPHYDIICQAAHNHNFSCPEILVGCFVYSSTHPYSGDQTHGYDIVAQAVSLPSGQGHVIPGSVATHYRVNGGGFTPLQMLPTGNPDEYKTTIPVVPYGSVVEYYITATDSNGSNGVAPTGAPTNLYYFQVGNDFPDQMETQTAWKVGAPDDNATTGIWERVDPIGTTYNGQVVQPEDDHTADPGHICYITQNGTVGGAAGDADVDNGKTTLFSPKYDLTGATQVNVSYWEYYTNDRGNNPGADYWTVDISNDGGATWQHVEYTTTSTDAWVQGTITSEQFFQRFPTPGVVQFRFIADDEPPGTLVEAGVDDFELAAVFNVADAGNLNIRLVTGLQQNRPNPFNPLTEISFRLAQAGPVTLAVYDAAGRQVRTLATGPQAAGDHKVLWNGIDDAGRNVASGTYFCRLNAGGKMYSSHMVLLK